MGPAPGDEPRRAEELARSLLAEALPRRWAHTQGVARRVRELAPLLGSDTDLVETAAWLHDIGYSPGLVDTGLHSLDGARFLRYGAISERLDTRTVNEDATRKDSGCHGTSCAEASQPAPGRPRGNLSSAFPIAVPGLVAHHTYARFEAEERGLQNLLDTEFSLTAIKPELLAALTVADLTTSPNGLTVAPNMRLAEISARYPFDHPVSRAIRRAKPEALDMCAHLYREHRSLRAPPHGPSDPPPKTTGGRFSPRTSAR